MWVTPKTEIEGPAIVVELSIFKHQTNIMFRSVFNSNYGTFKNGEAAHFTTNRSSLQAGIKPP